MGDTPPYRAIPFWGSRSSQNRVTDFWFDFFFGVTLLGATRSETSGGTPRDLLEARCGALQVLSWRFTEDFGCKFDADFVVQSFVAEFLVRLLARIFQMGVRFLGSIFLQKAPNRRIAHLKKIKPKIQTQNSYPIPNTRVRFWKGVGRWWGRRAVYGWLLVGSRQGKQGYRTQLRISSLHCLLCTVCLEFCEYRL